MRMPSGTAGLPARVYFAWTRAYLRYRVWLDMLGEPRGEDAASIFRAAVIGWWRNQHHPPAAPSGRCRPHLRRGTHRV